MFHKGILGDLDGADIFHPLLAFPLPLEHLHFLVTSPP